MSNKLTGIYKIENLVNGKVYIGQSINVANRWRVHRYDLRNNRRVGSHLQNAWNKYGEENFKFEIIEECSSTELNEREIYWIEYYKNTGVYNLTDGGEGIKNPSVETRYKMRMAKLGKPLSDITKKRISASNKGKIGHIQSQETRFKLSISHKGKSASTFQKYAAKKLMLNRWQDDKWVIKMSNIHKGNSYAKGYKHTNEEIEKIRQASLNRILSDKTKEKISKALKGKPKSEQHRQKIGQIAKGRIWINNSIKSKMIYPEQLSMYKELGFVLGRLKIERS